MAQPDLGVRECVRLAEVQEGKLSCTKKKNQQTNLNQCHPLQSHSVPKRAPGIKNQGFMRAESEL